MKKYLCIVPVSGGKDSQACLKMAVETFAPADVLALFCDTQFEHPKTYAHINSIAELYGVDLKIITGGSVEEKILKYGRFPGGGARHCTDELKIRETRIFLKEYSEKHGQCRCGMECARMKVVSARNDTNTETLMTCMSLTRFLPSTPSI